jgi:hypothetical protein
MEAPANAAPQDSAQRGSSRVACRITWNSRRLASANPRRLLSTLFGVATNIFFATHLRAYPKFSLISGIRFFDFN